MGLYIPRTERFKTDRNASDKESQNDFRTFCRQEQLSDTVNLKIAEPDGRWLGKGNSIKTLEQPINRNPVTLPQGNVIFRIEQGMRMEEMAGVKDVGIKIEKVQTQG